MEIASTTYMCKFFYFEICKILHHKKSNEKMKHDVLESHTFTPIYMIANFVHLHVTQSR